MKLSNETLTVLKNFATINQGIQFKQGKNFPQFHLPKLFWLRAGINDEFPQEFCIYDLNQFLMIYNLKKNCELISQTQILSSVKIMVRTNLIIVKLHQK
jgi:hypothetical protein